MPAVRVGASRLRQPSDRYTPSRPESSDPLTPPPSTTPRHVPTPEATPETGPLNNPSSRGGSSPTASPAPVNFDPIEVAYQQRQRQLTDYRYALAGLAPPLEIAKNQGMPDRLPSGIRYFLETDVQRQARQNPQAGSQTDNSVLAQLLALLQGQRTTGGPHGSGLANDPGFANHPYGLTGVYYP